MKKNNFQRLSFQALALLILLSFHTTSTASGICDLNNRLIPHATINGFDVDTDKTSLETTPKKISEANVTGHVIDKSTGEHIPLATIRVKASSLGVAADINGHYHLGHLPTEAITLIASATGFENQEISVTPVANKTIEVNFELEPAMLNLDAVVVSSSRTETTRRQAPGIVNVLTPVQFEQRAVVSLAEAMQCQPGVQITFDCQNCGSSQLKMNGLGGAYTQILMDSRPIFSSLASVYGLEQVPPSMIDRIEVVRGGGSALFGSNAIGGVVNIITKEPLKNTGSISNTTSINEKGGYDANTMLNASLVSKDFNSGVYVFGMLRNRSAYDRDNDGFSDIPEMNSASVGFKAYHKINNQNKISAEYHHISDYRRGGDSLDLQPHQTNITEMTRHEIDGGGLKYDWFSPNLRHRLNVYASAQNIKRRSYYGTDHDLNAYGRTHDLTAIVGGQYIYSFKKLWFMPAELSAGVEYNYNQLQDVLEGYKRDFHQSVNTVGMYAQNEWKSEKAGIVVGVRVDKHSMIKQVVASPRVNFRYEPAHWVSLRAGYSSGYRAPQAYDEDLHIAAVGGEVSLIVVDPNLKPEYSHSATASAEFNHKIGRKLQASLLVEGFYTNINNYFDLVEHGRDEQGNLLLLRTNTKGIYVGGINLELNIATQFDLDIQASYTYQQSRYKEAFNWTTEPSVAPTYKLYRSPEHYGYISAIYNPIKNLTLSTTANFTGKMLVEHYAGFIEKDAVTETPIFCDMDIRLAYNFEITRNFSLELSAGVKNIFDQYQKDLDKGMLRDAGYIYGPNLPRCYFVGLKLAL